MKVQEVILRAMAKKITWWQAAEIIGVSDRQMRRWRERLQEFGFEGLLDRRRCQPSEKRVALATVEQILGLYRDRYFDLNVRHFHEKLVEKHGIRLSYIWVKTALQGAGLVPRRRKRGVHRKRRARRPLPGMLLHIDGSQHRWLQDEHWLDLIVILDDANSEIYYAQLVEQESTLTVMAALREGIEHQGLFCALYSDRGSHFWLTPKAGGKVDPYRLTQGAGFEGTGDPDDCGVFAAGAGALGTQLRHLARTLAARAAATWDQDPGGSQPFSARALYRRVQPPLPGCSRQRGTAFTRCARRDLDRIFSVQYERTVNRDNTVTLQNLVLQLSRLGWRATLAGCNVIVHQHPDGSLSISYGPHRLGHYNRQGELTIAAGKGAVEKTPAGKVPQPIFPAGLEIPPTTRDSHFPTATATGL